MGDKSQPCGFCEIRHAEGRRRGGFRVAHPSSRRPLFAFYRQSARLVELDSLLNLNATTEPKTEPEGDELETEEPEKSRENDDPSMDEPDYDETQHDEPDSEIDKPVDPYAQAIKTEVEKIYGKNPNVVFAAIPAHGGDSSPTVAGLSR